jgi:hypothetical protein
MLESIDLGSVRVIDQYSLAACTSLKEVDIPDSVEEIKRNAFRGCSSLERVIIGKGVSSIAAYSFIACTSLKDVTVDPDNPHFKSVDGVVYTKDMKELVLCPSDPDRDEFILPASVDTVRSGALVCCRSLKRILVEEGNCNYASRDGVLYNRAMDELIRCPISDIDMSKVLLGVEHICDDAFAGSDIVNVKIPDSVKTIGRYAFYDCTSLEDITLPKNLKWVDQCGFYRCTSLRTVRLPAGMMSFEVGEHAFAYCPVGIDLISPAGEEEVHVYDLRGTMLYDLSDNGLRDFEGVLGILWGDVSDDPSKRWMNWISNINGQ